MILSSSSRFVAHSLSPFLSFDHLNHQFSISSQDQLFFGLKSQEHPELPFFFFFFLPTSLICATKGKVISQGNHNHFLFSFQTLLIHSSPSLFILSLIHSFFLFIIHFSCIWILSSLPKKIRYKFWERIPCLIQPEATLFRAKLFTFFMMKL